MAPSVARFGRVFLADCPASTRHVVLTDHPAQGLSGLVASGRHHTAREALRARLRLLERQEAARVRVRDAGLEGFDQFRCGPLAERTGKEGMLCAHGFGRTRDKPRQVG